MSLIYSVLLTRFLDLRGKKETRERENNQWSIKGASKLSQLIWICPTRHPREDLVVGVPDEPYPVLDHERVGYIPDRRQDV